MDPEGQGGRAGGQLPGFPFSEASFMKEKVRQERLT